MIGEEGLERGQAKKRWETGHESDFAEFAVKTRIWAVSYLALGHHKIFS